MYLVMSSDDSTYETAPMTFRKFLGHVRDGQFDDIRHVIAIKLRDGDGRARDATLATAHALFKHSINDPLSYNSPAYNLVERALSCWHAQQSICRDCVTRKEFA